MESRVKTVKEEIDVSNFPPEAVFSNIISWLPVKEAVRTSILLKYWKNAWKYVTHLDLDPASISEPNVELVRKDSQNGKDLSPTWRSIEDLIRCTSLYTSIIRSLKDEVTHCQIIHFPININSGELDKWVKELLMGKKVKVLSLSFYKLITNKEINANPLVLPPGTFSPLECLKLTCYRLLTTSPFQNCEKLRILKLSSLTLGTNSLTEIFSFCNALEELSMFQCQAFSKLEISSQNLKFLELRCLHTETINVSAEALTTLILDKVSCIWSYIVIDAPRVTELQVYCSGKGLSKKRREMYLSQEKLLERCTGFLSCHECDHRLYFPQMNYVSAFHNLQVLSTSLDLNDIRHAILLSYIFRVCFHLKRLDITVEDRDPPMVGNLYYPENLFWEEKEIFYCISNCLRAVSIQNFKGKVLEMEFLSYLIRRAPRMDRITVKCADNCTTEEVIVTESCLSFPKCSTNVSVVIHPPSPAAGKAALLRILGRDGCIM